VLVRVFADISFIHIWIFIFFFSYFRTHNCIRLLHVHVNPVRNNNNNGNTQEVLFSAIFRQYEHRLYKLAHALTKSDQVSKDIIQEVFMKLWEHRDQMATILNMEAWLYRLTENKVIDFMRKVAADDRLRRRIWQDLQLILNEAETQLASKEYHIVIRKAIDQLPPQRKLIYQLNKEDGMNYQEIADELRISRHTVKNQLFSAVQSIRRFISRNSFK